jgi:hypothetical protein
MTKDEFQSRAKRASSMLMEAVEQAEALIQISNSLQGTLALDTDYTAAGAAFQSVFTALGSGAASNRAKLDKIR